jgi:hypothetical protein
MIREPEEAKAPRAELSPSTRMFLLAMGAQLRQLLRPSARRDLGEYVKSLTSDTEAQPFLDWAKDVVEAHRSAKTRRAGRARALVRAAPDGVFTRPETAFRVRWLL